MLNKRQIHIMHEENITISNTSVSVNIDMTKIMFDEPIIHRCILNLNGIMIVLGFNTSMDGITINQPNGKFLGL
jgi:hypothetical protein